MPQDELHKPQYHSQIRLWRRIVAGTMAFLMLAFIILVDAVRVRLRDDTDSKITNAAASHLIENDTYAKKDLMGRIMDAANASLKKSETFTDFYEEASILIAQAKYEKALVAVEKCIELYDGDDKAMREELYMKSGCLYALLEKYDETLESFSKLSSSSIYTDDKLKIESQIYIERKEYEKAQRSLTEYISRNPKDSDMRFLAAEVSYLNSDFDLAIEQYNVLIDQLGDENGAKHMLRGICYMGKGEAQSALNDYEQALSLGYEDQGACYSQMALCATMLGDNEKTLEYGGLAIEIGSDTVEWATFYRVIGIAAMQLEKYKDSIGYFDQAVEIDDQITEVYYYRGTCKMALEQLDSAISDFTASIERDQLAELCHYNRGICYLLTKKYDKAKADFNKVIEISSSEELIKSSREFIKTIK